MCTYMVLKELGEERRAKTRENERNNASGTPRINPPPRGEMKRQQLVRPTLRALRLVWQVPLDCLGDRRRVSYRLLGTRQTGVPAYIPASHTTPFRCLCNRGMLLAFRLTDSDRQGVCLVRGGEVPKTKRHVVVVSAARLGLFTLTGSVDSSWLIPDYAFVLSTS